MACATKIKTTEKKFRVLVLQCPDCGEEKYYIVVCDHCGETLEYKETKLLTYGEIKKLLAEGIEINGDLSAIMGEEEDDFDVPSEAKKQTTDDDVELPPLDESELDDLFDSDDFEPL